MRVLLHIYIAVIFSISSFTASVRAQDVDTLVALTNQDVPRGFLAEAAARKLEPSTKGVGIPFYIPESAKDGVLYGIDISHHSFTKKTAIDWNDLKARKIAFVYMKATEGVNNFDGTFRSSWSALGQTGPIPLRGAYHFFRALEDPQKQAETFLKVLRDQSDYTPGRDLPPVVDIEWDCSRDKKGRPIYRDGRCAHDNWSDLAPDEIVLKIETFLSVVKSELHVDPVIYTATSWWHERKVDTAQNADGFLKDNKFWIADYTRAAQKNADPRMPVSRKWTIWQFTDNGKLTNDCNPKDKKSNCTDTNAVFLSEAAFHQAMGIIKQ